MESQNDFVVIRDKVCPACGFLCERLIGLNPYVKPLCRLCVSKLARQFDRVEKTL